jgi:hypothetical protein
LAGDELACVTISLSPTEELATKAASYARPTINFVTDARAVLSEKHLGTKFYIPILNWTLELLKLSIEVL